MLSSFFSFFLLCKGGLKQNNHTTRIYQIYVSNKLTLDDGYVHSTTYTLMHSTTYSLMEIYDIWMVLLVIF